MSDITTDEAIRNVIYQNQGTLLAKINAKSTFRLISVHLCNCHLLRMEWKGRVYIDT